MKKETLFRFEKLDVWNLAREFNRELYSMTANFPKDELYGLTGQMRRASVSVSSNIAEGSGRNSDVDFAHFLEVAYGSLMEVLSQAFIAFDQGCLSSGDLDTLRSRGGELAAKLAAFSKSLGRRRRMSKKAVDHRH